MFFRLLRALCALMLFASAGFAQADACTNLGTIQVLGNPLSSFTSTSGPFNHCYTFELTGPTDPGPLASSESGARFIATIPTWGNVALWSITVEGPIGRAVSNPGLAVDFGNIPNGLYELFIAGTSSGPASGHGVILAATPLVAVPEPETGVLLLAGLGIAGFIRLRANDRRNA